MRGRQYETVVSNVVNGASDDYFYHEKGLYSTIVEDAREFQPQVGEALMVTREIAAGAREMLHVALEYSQQHGLEKNHPPAFADIPPLPEAG